MRKLVALDSETLDLPDSTWSPLKAFGKLVRHDHTPSEETTILERCAGAEVVFSNKVPLRGPVLEKLPDLKLICVLATGTNNVDLEAARDLGIAVRNVPAYSTQSVAQHATALLLELTNRTAHYSRAVHAGDWIRSRQFCFWQHSIPELSGRTAGFIGFGQIGRATAAVFHALGMRIIAHTRTPRNNPDWEGFEWKSVEEIFAEADVISLHCPQTEDNLRMVNRALLDRCKPGALLINTARGPLINEADLRAALDNGKLAGAGLDVLSQEPMAPDSPLLEAPNCIITPHIAWASMEARERLMAITVDNVRTFFKQQ
ncbi:MAG: D-2-hydroxyacid dehydrogenase [Opitutales bacterium]|jgi:glycerate dehydrogenase